MSRSLKVHVSVVFAVFVLKHVCDQRNVVVVVYTKSTV